MDGNDDHDDNDDEGADDEDVIAMPIHEQFHFRLRTVYSKPICLVYKPLYLDLGQNCWFFHICENNYFPVAVLNLTNGPFCMAIIKTDTSPQP